MSAESRFTSEMWNSTSSTFRQIACSSMCSEPPRPEFPIITMSARRAGCLGTVYRSGMRSKTWRLSCSMMLVKRSVSTSVGKSPSRASIYLWDIGETPTSRAQDFCQTHKAEMNASISQETWVSCSPTAASSMWDGKTRRVKIRGNRIELGEVESALLTLDAIRDAAVIAAADRAGNRHLVAYVVAAEKPPPSIGALRRAMAALLPDHMIPSIFVLLDAMPLTSSGKLDRHSLPEPDKARPELETPYAAARNSVEAILTEIWADAIGVEPIGIHDNFFELGGDSLLATRIVSRILQHFRLEIPLRSLFQFPTVAEMGTLITEHQKQRLRRERACNDFQTGSNRCPMRTPSGHRPSGCSRPAKPRRPRGALRRDTEHRVRDSYRARRTRMKCQRNSRQPFLASACWSASSRRSARNRVSTTDD